MHILVNCLSVEHQLAILLSPVPCQIDGTLGENRFPNTDLVYKLVHYMQQFKSAVVI